MPTDPNDKMRTPGAAARRDMDGRANQPKEEKSGGCLRWIGLGLVLSAGGVTAVVEVARAVHA